MSLIAGAVGAGFGLLQTFMGARERRKYDKKLDETELLEYTGSEAYQQAHAIAEQQNRYANEGIAAGAFNRAVDMGSRAQATGVSQLQERGAGTAGVASATQSMTDYYGNLFLQEEEARRQAREMNFQAQSLLLEAKDKGFDQSVSNQNWWSNLYMSRSLRGTRDVGDGLNNLVGGIGLVERAMKA